MGDANPGDQQSNESQQLGFSATCGTDVQEESIKSGGGAVQKAQLFTTALSPPLVFQEEVMLEYDLERYRFLQVLHDILQEPRSSDLAHLHETPYAQQIIVNFQRNPLKVEALGPRGNPWNKRFSSCAQKYPQLYSEFMQIYHDFVQTFVLKHLQTERVAFQNCPTFRCHLPGCGAPGRPHRDEDYRHPQSEVNFWIPLTPVFGSNSLYAESKRGNGDFRPFELSVGKLVRFYANQVWHYTVPNETDSTRVSIDFRVIREQEWTPASFSSFKLGGYYSVMGLDGLLPQSSPEMQMLQDMYQCGRAERKPSNLKS